MNSELEQRVQDLEGTLTKIFNALSTVIAKQQDQLARLSSLTLTISEGLIEQIARLDVEVAELRKEPIGPKVASPPMGNQPWMG